MGGFMCHRVACEMNSRVAAIASVAGTIGNSMTSTPPAPMPVLHCHGTADSQVGYTDNNYGVDAEELVDYWVNQNNCDATPVVENIPDNVADDISVEKHLYQNGDYNTEVEFYKAVGTDHQWLYPPVNDMSYTIVIWEFFKRHSKEPFVNTNEINNSENFAVYPVPASDFLLVKSKSNAVFELYSSEGKLIKIEEVTGETRIDISNLKSGVYFYKLYNSLETISEKVIISN
jgi:polyhydroxybutyrate depolymerase